MKKQNEYEAVSHDFDQMCIRDSTVSAGELPGVRNKI